MVASIVVTILVGIGLLLLVLPGVFLALSFYFVTQRIAVEDENFVEAMSESWALAKGERLELFVLAVVLVVLSFAVGLPTLVLADAAPLVSTLYNLAVSAPVAVFGTATVSRAYVQLTAASDEADEEVGALGPDDIPADHDS